MAATLPTACARSRDPRRPRPAGSSGIAASGIAASGIAASGIAAFAGGLRLSGAPGFAGAVGLARVPDSGLVSESCVRHLALFPRHLGRLRSGIGEQLGAELLRYSESLKGVPLAYDNIKLLSGLGDLIDDQGYIHMDVQADFVIFRPNPGDIIKGVVNKVGSAHVGCLVHGCFNASLACPSDEPGAPWQGARLVPGDTVRFTVTHVDSDWAGVLLVRGSLIGLGVPDESDAEQANGAVKQEHQEVQDVPVEYTDSAPSEKKKEKKKRKREVGVTIKVEETMEVEEVVEHRHKERKKKKSKRKGESDGEEPNCDGVTRLPVKEEPEGELCTEIGSVEEACTSQIEAAVTPDHQKKKKKKKRRRDRVEEGSTVPLSDGYSYLSNDVGHEANGTLTSDPEAPKKEKKRKRSSVEEISFSESPLPKSKRRK
ncbi:DNA-directed RNA polymerase I subunit RPA43 [Petromyzon marinus]|uniref:DNA-directed RNA polymerase I subunit RPA43 n=1 Tax=Petromyzon marinus TaxID=7757 RepID=UPI003F706574